MSTLCIDVGQKKSGLAYAGSTGIPIVLDTVQATNFSGLWSAVAPVIKSRSVGTIILGLPVETSGNEGSQAAFVRKFSRFVQFRFDGVVALVDERLSSRGALSIFEPLQSKSGKRKQFDDDGSAALLILETYLSNPTVGEICDAA